MLCISPSQYYCWPCVISLIPLFIINPTIYVIVFIISGKIPTGFRYQAKLHCELC